MRMNAWKDKQHDIHLLRMETFSNDDETEKKRENRFSGRKQKHIANIRHDTGGIQEIQKKRENISDYTFIVQIIISLASKQCHILYIIQLLFSPPPQHSFMLDEKRTLATDTDHHYTIFFLHFVCRVCCPIHSLFSSQLNLVSCRPPLTTPNLTHNMSSTINFFHFTEILFSFPLTNFSFVLYYY